MEPRPRGSSRDGGLGERDRVVEDATAAVVVAAGPEREEFPFGGGEADEGVGEEELEGVGAGGGVGGGEEGGADCGEVGVDLEEEGVEVEARVFGVVGGGLRREGVGLGGVEG